MQLRRLATVFALGMMAAACGSDADPGSSAFTFDENFEFEEPGNVEPNGDPNVVANGDPNIGPNPNVDPNVDPNNIPEPACPTEVVGTNPDGAAAIDRGGFSPIIAYRTGDQVVALRREDRGWVDFAKAPAGDAREVEVAGIIEGARTEQFWLATTSNETTLYLCSSDACIERNTYDFADAVELYSTSDEVVYISGVSINEPLPTFIIYFFSNGRSGRHAFAEAPSIPTQFGLTPISRPNDPLFRTEFRAAWDTGDLPLSFVSVNTSLLMELEPECNRLDLLGGRILPLQSSQGILVAAAGEGGSAVTYDACDGISAPFAIEASRGLVDFDVAYPEDPSARAWVYWIQANSVWGTAIDANSGMQLDPIRRIAAVPGAQAVRATELNGRRTIVVTTNDEVLAIEDDEACSEFGMF